MNGKYLLDTNVIIYALNHALVLPDGDYFISVITEMELLSFPKISDEEERTIKELISAFTVIPLQNDIKDQSILFRRKYGFKLPDSIICATAFTYELVLVSNNLQLTKCAEVNVHDIKLIK